MVLFKYLLLRTFTRLGNSPLASLQIRYGAMGGGIGIERDLRGSPLSTHRLA
jgi:hypothetical protein